MQSDDPMNGQKALEEFIKGKPEGTYGLCIFDDFVKQNARPDDPYKVCMVSVCQFLRNEGYHNIMISQSPKSIPEGARNNVNLRICFKLESPLSVSVMRNEFIGSGMGPKHYFERVYKAMLIGGRFSYFVLVSDQDDPRIFIHQQKKGEDHLQRIPLYDQYISHECEATSRGADDDEEEFDEEFDD